MWLEVLHVAKGKQRKELPSPGGSRLSVLARAVRMERSTSRAAYLSADAGQEPSSLVPDGGRRGGCTARYCMGPGPFNRRCSSFLQHEATICADCSVLDFLVCWPTIRVSIVPSIKIATVGNEATSCEDSNVICLLDC